MSRIQQSEKPIEQPEEPEVKPSLTPNAFQRKWKTETEFPCCPTDPKSTLDDYLSNLHTGDAFSRNQYGETVVVECAKTDDTLLVFGKAANQDAVKNWYLCGITKADGFLHTNLGSFFTEQGARKQYTLKHGLEWTGGDSIDDYC